MASKDASEDQSAWEKSGSAFEGKLNSEYLDPCADFAARSIKCLHRNGNDKDICNHYFTQYKECKKQWMAERSAEKKRNKKGWFS